MAANTCNRPPEEFRGDGTTTKFQFCWPYISADDLVVYLWNDDTNEYEKCIRVNGTNADACTVPSVPIEYYITSPSCVEINFCVAPPLPPTDKSSSFSNIIVTRESDICAMMAIFYPGSQIRAEDLNNNFTQLLFLIQEVPSIIKKAIAEIIINADQINPEDVITGAEVDAGYPYPDWDDTKLITGGASKRTHNFYGGTEPPGGKYPGKLWFEPGSTEYLRIWTGSGWKVIQTNTGSVAPFEPAEIIYVNTQGNDANNGKSKETAVRSIEQALKIANTETKKPAVSITTATYNKDSGQCVIDTATPHGLIQGNSVLVSPMSWKCSLSPTPESFPVNPKVFPVQTVTGPTQFSIFAGFSGSEHTFVPGSGGTADPVDTVFGDGKIISVAAGVYAEENLPLQVKAKNLSIIGDSLRNTYVHPAVPNTNAYNPNDPVGNELQVMFEMDSGSYLTGFTIAGLKAKGSVGGNPIDTDPLRGLPEFQGWVASFRPGSVITKSPYIQNCTNFADSSTDNRVKGIYSNGTGFDPDFLGGEGGDTTSAPCGGGILCDGNRPAKSSPLRSFVVDAFTQIALEGPGILCCNLAYAQLVSFFGTFCKYHAKVLTGGQLNLSNCTTDFGEFGLIADGKSGQIFTGAAKEGSTPGKAVVAGDPGDQQEIVKIKTAVFSKADGSLEMEPSTALASAVLPGTLVKIQFLRFQKAGTPDRVIPESFSKEYAVISGDEKKFKIIIGSAELDGYTYLADSGDLLVPTGGTNGPKPSTLITVDTLGNRSPLWQAPRATVPGTTMLMEAGGVLYPIVNATPKSATDKSEFVIEVFSPLNAFNRSNLGFVKDVDAGATVSFYLQSYISTGGHTMEFVGSGTNYTAHPDYGGVPVVSNQAIELGGDQSAGAPPQLVPYNGGRVWLSSTDQDGNFNVGDTFQVNQKTGQIYIDPSVIVQPPLKIQENLDMGPWSIYTTYGTDTNINIAPKGDGGLVIGGDVKTNGSAPVGPSTAPIVGPVKERSVVDTAGNTKDFPVVTQEDLGYDADEIPVSGLLGKLAFTDTPSVVGVSDSPPLPNEIKFSVSGNTLTLTYQPPSGTAKTTTLTLS